MKQGEASSSGPADRKREPISQAMSPKGAGQIGIIQGKAPVNIYAGRGYTAPMTGSQTHPKGSQGKR